MCGRPLEALQVNYDCVWKLLDDSTQGLTLKETMISFPQIELSLCKCVCAGGCSTGTLDNY